MIKIIDNFMPDAYFTQLQDFVLSANFPWFYIPRVSKGGNPRIPNGAIETFALTHRVLSAEDGNKSFAYDYFQPLINNIEHQLNQEYKVIRIRAVLKTFKHGFTQSNYNIPHVDLPIPHLSAIFYLNESDGDTWLFNQFYQGEIEPTNFTVKDRVAPRSNRLLLFDGLQYHTASNPINSDLRVIININCVKQNVDIRQEFLNFSNKI